MKPQFANATDKKTSGAFSNIKLEGRNKVLFYIGALVVVPILVLLIGVYAFFSNSAQYTITLSYEYQKVSGSKVIEASTDGASGFKITKLDNTDGISAFQNTTGQKPVGQKSAGKITVFNATADIKVIKKGTAITCISTACNGLIYTALNDLNLGPGNSVNDYDIVANDIGENYNLATNAGRFKVGSFNSTTEIIASNIAPISGGTPKTFVKIVSAEDIKAVEAKANEDLKNLIITNIRSNTENNSKYIISDTSFVLEKISSQTDPEGTEAEVVNTSLRAKGTVDAFPKEQVQKVYDEIEASITPEGFYIDEKTIEPGTKVLSSTPGKISIEVTYAAVARVIIDEEKIAKEIGGKSLEDAEKYLESLPNIKSHTAVYTPSTMPGFLRRVPGNPEKIDITILALDPPSSL